MEWIKTTIIGVLLLAVLYLADPTEEVWAIRMRVDMYDMETGEMLKPHTLYTMWVRGKKPDRTVGDIVADGGLTRVTVDGVWQERMRNPWLIWD